MQGFFYLGILGVALLADRVFMLRGDMRRYLANGWQSLAPTLAAIFLNAGFTPMGVILASSFPAGWFEPLMALTAGNSIYVGASHLMPEAHLRFN